MNIEQLLENEKENMKDYLYSYCDNPLETASEEIKELFLHYGMNTDNHIREIRDMLEENEIDSYFCSTIPPSLDNTIWFNISEIEIAADCLEEEEKDDFAINGEYAYYYIGYGMMIEYSLPGIEKSIQEWITENSE